jgi:hypothetical protein
MSSPDEFRWLAPGYQNPQKVRQIFLAIAEKVRHIRGVQSVALNSRVPLGGGNDNGLLPEGRALDMTSAIASRFQMVTPEIFATLRIPLKEGRPFNALDRAGAPNVMIINQTLAKQAFPGALLTNDIRGIVARIAPGTPFADVSTMEQRISQSVEQKRFTTMLLTTFSAVALLLASIGIHRVLSYSVMQRKREIGNRCRSARNAEMF